MIPDTIDTPNFSTWPVLALIKFAHDMYVKNVRMYRENETLRLELKAALACVTDDWK